MTQHISLLYTVILIFAVSKKPSWSSSFSGLTYKHIKANGYPDTVKEWRKIPVGLSNS